jgi:hypothetical protein
MVRSLLSEAANVLLTRVSRWSWLKRWGIEVARRRGKLRAQVAVARRLAVIMHRMWIDGTAFSWTRSVAGARLLHRKGRGKTQQGEESAQADASGRARGLATSMNLL